MPVQLRRRRARPGVTIEPFGEAALRVVLGRDPGLALSAACQAVAAAVRNERRVGVPWAAPTPGHTSVLVPFDPARLDPEDAEARLAALVARAGAERPGTIRDRGAAARGAARPAAIALHVRYGGPDGPDLGAVAELTGLAPAQVVEAHASTVYTVGLLGFLPGFAYLASLPDELSVPRRAEPRPRVAPGSVGLAGHETCVYAVASPGGWQLIGRTSATLWDPRRDPPALLAPGDRVRFVPEAPGG